MWEAVNSIHNSCTLLLYIAAPSCISPVITVRSCLPLSKGGGKRAAKVQPWRKCMARVCGISRLLYCVVFSVGTLTRTVLIPPYRPHVSWSGSGPPPKRLQSEMRYPVKP